MKFPTHKVLGNILFIYLSITTVWSACPQTILDPCDCRNNSIYCEGNGKLDLVNIFNQLEKDLSPNEKHFNLFYLSNTDITELKDNTFKDLTFEKIHIENCTKLELINVDTFVNTYERTRVIEIWNNPVLTTLDGSLFDDLSKFTNVEEISLGFNNITEIPSNAFERPEAYQDKLKKLTFAGPSIKQLGNNPFSKLRNLSILNLGYTSIESIPETGLEFYETSGITLTINFELNTKLNSASFALFSLTRLNRPAVINFGFKGNNIEYLDENVFKPFLTNNKQNTIDLRDQSFNCKDCRNRWIPKFQDLRSNIRNLICRNGTDLDDNLNFRYCGISQFDGSCTSTETVVHCGGNKPINLKAVFKSFSQTLETEEKRFDEFILDNTVIPIIEENVFEDLTFNKITIQNCTLLTTITRNAFMSTEFVTKEIVIKNNPVLVSTTENLFEVLSRFLNVESIELSDNQIPAIPPNAFKPVIGYQNKLKSLIFKGCTIKTIGASPFAQLKQLSKINFENLCLTAIPANVFAFDDPSDISLQINYSGIPTTPYSSAIFLNGSLINMKRPTELVFGSDIDRNRLGPLREPVFLPFFNENAHNTVNFLYQKLDCANCDNYWLRKYRPYIERLRASEMECSNGRLFADTENFKGCVNHFYSDNLV